MIINHSLEIAVMITYSKEELPYLSQWKCMRSGEYVLGLEPGNCDVGGRASARSDGRLKFIQPGEVKFNRIVVDVISGENAIAKTYESFFQAN
jgi:hypothetical protein